MLEFILPLVYFASILLTPYELSTHPSSVSAEAENRNMKYLSLKHNFTLDLLLISKKNCKNSCSLGVLQNTERPNSLKHLFLYVW